MRLKFITLLAVSLVPVVLHAATLMDLDSIQDQAGSLNEFIANASLRQSYLKTAQEYFGGASAFPKASFDAILEQLSQMAKSDATIGERAWQKEPLGPTFSVTIDNQAGLPIDYEKWLDYRAQAHNRIRQKAGEYFDWWVTPEKTETFVANVQKAQKEIKNILGQDGYSKEVLSEVVGKYESLIAALLYYQIEEEDNKEGLQSQNWETLTTVTQKLARRSNLNWGTVFSTSPMLTQYWKMIEPEFLKVAENYKMFAHHSQASPEKFRTLTFRATRPFHALFRGLIVKECTAGDCSLLARLSARRYAIPLLKGAWVQFLEENSKASGHLQGVFLRNPSFGTILNMDFMAGKLREQVGDHSLYELWLREVQSYLGKDIAGVAIGESLNANNEKMQEFVHTKKSYLLGRIIGAALDFSVLDGEMAYRICLLGWRLEKEHHYENSLTFDGCDIKAGRLHLLNSQLVDARTISDDELVNLWSDPLVDRKQLLNFATRAFQTNLAVRDPKGFRNTIEQFNISPGPAEAYVQFLAERHPIEQSTLTELKRSNQLFIRRGLARLFKSTGFEDDLSRLSQDELEELAIENSNVQRDALLRYTQCLRIEFRPAPIGIHEIKRWFNKFELA